MGTAARLIFDLIISLFWYILIWTISLTIRASNHCIGLVPLKKIISISQARCKAIWVMPLVWLRSMPNILKPSLGKVRGAGVFEIVEDHRGDTDRAVYTVRFVGVVYVLHAFQKKSKTGIKTPQPDINLIAERLKRAKADYESTQGTSITGGQHE